jgi:hypothetical protein
LISRRAGRKQKDYTIIKIQVVVFGLSFIKAKRTDKVKTNFLLRSPIRINVIVGESIVRGASYITAQIHAARFSSPQPLFRARRVLVSDVRFVVDLGVDAHFLDRLTNGLIVCYNIADGSHHIRVPASGKNRWHRSTSLLCFSTGHLDT